MVALLSILLSLAWGAAQAPVTRVVILPFDAEASIEAFSVAFPVAMQRALNEIDGVYVPPVSDPGVVLQRVLQFSEAPVADLMRVFAADRVVFGRLAGSDNLTLELVVVDRDGGEALRSLVGNARNLPGLWQAAVDAVTEIAGINVAPGDRAAVARILADAPSLASLGPVAASSARLPGVRLDQLELALALDGDSAWVQAEAARVMALQGQAERAALLARRAVALIPAAETHTVLGIVLLSQGDGGAQAAFEEALRANPSHAVALAALAQAGVPTDQSVAYLERAIVASPRLSDAHLALATLQSSTARVVQVLRTASLSLPDSVNVQVALVGAALDANDARGAASLLRAAIADPVGRRPAVYALAERFAVSLPTDALSIVREGLQSFPNDAGLRSLEITLLRGAGEDAAAVAAIEAWIEDGSAPLAQVMAWAEFLATRGQYEDAQRVIAALPDNGDRDLRAAQLDLAAGRAADVVARLEPAVRSGSIDPLSNALYGVALGRLGRVEEAIGILQRVIERSAGAIDARSFEAADYARRALAVLTEQSQVIDGAQRVALSAAASAAFEQGLYALEQNDVVAARDAFIRARNLQDVGFIAFYEGYTRQLLGDPRGAMVAYQAARPGLGANPVLLNNLGFAQLQVGRLDLALDTLREAVLLDGQNARAHFNLALTYYGLSRFPDAVASFDRALALDPSLQGSAAAVIEESRRRAAP
jgi:tetratricopeptide (TPR) repeat protein